MVAEWVLNTAILAFHLVVEVRIHVHDVGGWIEGTEVARVEDFRVAYFPSGSKTGRSNN